MQNSIEKVAAFHEVGGHPVQPANDFKLLTIERAESRANWMMEEVAEFEVATRTGDLGEAFDALGDLLYFAFGTVAEMGGQEVLPLIFDRIHQANMSKFDATEADAQATVAAYKEQGVEVHYRPVTVGELTYWPVYFAAGPKAGKIAKSHQWTAPDFRDLLPPAQLR